MTSCHPDLLRARLAPHRTGVALAERLARVVALRKVSEPSNVCRDAGSETPGSLTSPGALGEAGQPQGQPVSPSSAGSVRSDTALLDTGEGRA